MGHTLLRARDAQEALRAADSHLPDAIVSGELTPPLDGVELCWAIRKTSRVPLSVFVLTTRKVDSSLRLRAYRTGVDLVASPATTAQELMEFLQTQVTLRTAMQLPELVAAGNLRVLHPLALLEIVTNAGLSGRLELRGPGQLRGRVYVHKGQVVHAETDDKSGKEALLQLAGLTDGSYAFYRENLSPERTITEPTPQLILDLARSLDERSTGSQTS